MSEGEEGVGTWQAPCYCLVSGEDEVRGVGYKKQKHLVFY